MARYRDFPPIPTIIGKTPFFSVAYYSPEGKRLWASTGKTTMREAKEVLWSWIDEETKTIKPKKGNKRLRDCFDDLFTSEDRPSTVRGYQYMIDRILKSDLADIEIHKINKNHISTFLDKLFSGLADKSQESYHKAIKAVFSRVDNKEKSGLKALLPQVKKSGKKTKRPISKADFYRVWKSFPLSKKEFKLAFLLGHLLGLRVGELTALTPEKIITKNKKFHLLISHGFDYNTKRMISLEGEKNFRYLPMPNGLGAELTEFCFDKKEGERIFHYYPDRYTQEIKDVLGQEKEFNFHLGRDFVSTYFLEDCQVWEVELALGHTLSENQSTYSHPQPGQFPGIAKYQERLWRKEVDLGIGEKVF